MKAAILILSDPKLGSEESLGRLFNALSAVYDFQLRGDEVIILFNGTGTRWVGVLQDENHPAFELFQLVKENIAGVSCGCADVFGASDDVEKSGYELIKDNPVPGTTGLPSIPSIIRDGYTILTF